MTILAQLSTAAVNSVPSWLMTAVALGLVLGAVFTLCALLLICLQIWERLRPKTDIFVTRPEFDALKNQIQENRTNTDKHFAEIRFAIETLQLSVSQNNSDIMRAIGRLEGSKEVQP